MNKILHMFSIKFKTFKKQYTSVNIFNSNVKIFYEVKI